MVPAPEVGCCLRLGLRLIAFAFAAVTLLPATTYYVTISGIGGEDDFTQRFAGWTGDLDKTFQSIGSGAVVHTLGADESTRENVQSLFADLAKTATPDDALAVMLIGHGTFDGYQYKFNVKGRDITAEELAAWMDNVKAERQMIADMTSASGAALPVLQGPNRVVITATKTGTEKNAVVFARYFAASLSDASADTDKNEVISALEAFTYAARKTEEFYTSQQRLATEHPMIEDTGSGQGVREVTVENGQGLKAGAFPLLRIGQTQLAAQDPAKRELLDKKEQTEQQIDELKYDKAGMPTAQYRQQLAGLLVELAKTQAELDK